MHHSGEALGEISKEFVEIAVRGDRLGDLQERLVPFRESLTRGCRMPIHKHSVWPIDSRCSRASTAPAEDPVSRGIKGGQGSVRDDAVLLIPDDQQV